MMNPICSIIIDDEPSAIENLEILLAEIEYVEVGKTFTSAGSALDWLLENRCDLVFLDVEMPGKSGLEFLDDLKNYPQSPCIIFTTGHENYAIKAIRKSAFDFLLKPISKSELKEALQRFRLTCSTEKFRQHNYEDHKTTNPPKKIVFAHHRGFVAYQADEILYIEADRNYSHVHLTNGKEQIVSMQLGQIAKAILPSHFFRISRSIIINLTHFTHADQKLKKCFLEFNGKDFDFAIKVSKIRELQKVMVGE